MVVSQVNCGQLLGISNPYRVKNEDAPKKTEPFSLYQSIKDALPGMSSLETPECAAMDCDVYRLEPSADDYHTTGKSDDEKNKKLGIHLAGQNKKTGEWWHLYLTQDPEIKEGFSAIAITHQKDKGVPEEKVLSARKEKGTEKYSFNLKVGDSSYLAQQKGVKMERLVADTMQLLAYYNLYYDNFLCPKCK